MASPSFLPKTPTQRRITLAHIDAVVSARLGPTRGLGKSQPACFNRQIAMYLASHVGRWSTTVIGRFYSGRDHSTVVHAIQRIEALRDVEPDIDVLICDLKSKIVDGSERTTEPVVTIPRAVTPRSLPREADMPLVEQIASRVCEMIKDDICRIQAGDCGGAIAETEEHSCTRQRNLAGCAPRE